MNKHKKNNFEQKVLSLFVKSFKAHGLDELSAKLFSYIYLEPENISLDDLSEISGYSISAVSTKLKLFEGVGIIERVKKPGTKKVYYFMQKNMRQMTINKLKKALNTQIKPIKEHLPDILREYKSTLKNSKNTRFKEQFKIVENYLEQMKEMEFIMKKILSELEE